MSDHICDVNEMIPIELEGKECPGTEAASYALLEGLADRILIESGDSGLIEFAYGDGGIIKQVLDPFKPYGREMRGVPKLRGAVPSGDSRGIAIATAGPACEHCGGPRSKTGASLCRKCYSAKARNGFDARIANKWERVDSHFERYSYLLEYYIDFWANFCANATADFSIQLIDDISRWEELTQIPYVFWESSLACISAEQTDEDVEQYAPFRQKKSRSKQTKQNAGRMLKAAWRYQYQETPKMNSRNVQAPSPQTAIL